MPYFHPHAGLASLHAFGALLWAAAWTLRAHLHLLAGLAAAAVAATAAAARTSRQPKRHGTVQMGGRRGTPSLMCCSAHCAALVVSHSRAYSTAAALLAGQSAYCRLALVSIISAQFAKSASEGMTDAGMTAREGQGTACIAVGLLAGVPQGQICTATGLMTAEQATAPPLPGEGVLSPVRAV